MNLHRYKASFTSSNSTSEFFHSTTWIVYGFILCIILSVFIHGFVYYDNENGFRYEDDLNFIGYQFLSVLFLYGLKLLALNINVVGLFMSFLCSFTSILLLVVMIYQSVFNRLPIALFGAIIYYGLAGYLLFNDYKKLSSKTI